MPKTDKFKQFVVSAMTTLVARREPILRMRRHTRSLKCAAEDFGQQARARTEG
ncbi:MAG: hypothetical protein ABI686_00800 [Acidobacteriota bacterium]